jgi:hypothetical protein
MDTLGVNLSILMGPTAPFPAAAPIADSLERVEAIYGDDGASGFQIVFRADRRGLSGAVDYPLLKSPQLRLFNRVIALVAFKSPVPMVVVDGIITHIQLSSDKRGDYISVTGEDLSVLMDRDEVIAEHPGQSDVVIANKIIASYASRGLIPQVIPPPSLEIPSPTERTPAQRGTDLRYLKEMAQRHGHCFYVKPGKAPGTNIAYWGPPERVGMPQPALSVNMGTYSNVESIHFSNNGLKPVLAAGASVQDRRTNVALPLATFTAKNPALLAREPSILTNFANLGARLARDVNGLTYAEALARAQAMTDMSAASVVTAEGDLNAMEYGHVLTAPGIVGVRGVGDAHDGLYYVKEASHIISKGIYKQKFRLAREGVGAISPVLRP